MRNHPIASAIATIGSSVCAGADAISGTMVMSFPQRTSSYDLLVTDAFTRVTCTSWNAYAEGNILLACKPAMASPWMDRIFASGPKDDEARAVSHKDVGKKLGSVLAVSVISSDIVLNVYNENVSAM